MREMEEKLGRDVKGLFEGLLQLELISLSTRDCSQSGQSAHYVIDQDIGVDWNSAARHLPELSHSHYEEDFWNIATTVLLLCYADQIEKLSNC